MEKKKKESKSDIKNHPKQHRDNINERMPSFTSKKTKKVNY